MKLLYSKHFMSRWRLMYGILIPFKSIKKEIDKIRNLGVEIKTNMVIGKVFNIDELFEEAVNQYLLVQALACQFMKILVKI